jgi:hypothetical protein
MMRVIRKLADGRNENSLATRLRRKRFEIFSSLLTDAPRPLTILDVGGEQVYWQRMGLAHAPGIRFVIFNVFESAVTLPNFTSVVGDARDMRQFRDHQFDVVFSNSVIEHVGGRVEQARMAAEIRRVGKAFFVQTPNRNFFIEPHFLVPFFQFMPLGMKVFLIRHLNVTFTRKKWTAEEAAAVASEIMLLSEKDLRQMFPGASIAREKILGLTKSLMAYGGWSDLYAERRAAGAVSPRG